MHRIRLRSESTPLGRHSPSDIPYHKEEDPLPDRLSSLCMPRLQRKVVSSPAGIVKTAIPADVLQTFCRFTFSSRVQTTWRPERPFQIVDIPVDLRSAVGAEARGRGAKNIRRYRLGIGASAHQATSSLRRRCCATRIQPL